MKRNNKLYPVILLFVLIITTWYSQAQETTNIGKFQQLKQELLTPNVYRTASGTPGPHYWQQKVDYKISILLDETTQRIYGEETIIYNNNSPDDLNYLWVQLDQNMRATDSDTKKTQISRISEESNNTQEDIQKISFNQIKRFHDNFEGGFKLEYVKDIRNNDLPYVVNKTMMRIDLPEALKPGSSYSFKIKYWYNINNRATHRGRSGYEYFEKDNNYLFVIAQFHPRMAVYNDIEGWQNKQFLGSGEFTLCFGDFHVDITVPADHIVAATGVLQNPDIVLTPVQIGRLAQARNSDHPVMIVTEKEAVKNESSRIEGTKTWSFKAENVRDFGFASSRKFIWDALGVNFGERTVMAMSFYPREGNPLWEQYSTKAVAHTLDIYSKYTFDYPYPVAQSVHTNSIGMEYPMICFNGGRPEPDGTYSESTKWGMIGVVIHEVGHNYFPMIVNSDERQWTWMDEGLNTFLQGIAQREWDRNYSGWRGNPANIVDYMKGDKKFIRPIMTNSESAFSLGSNAYAKPATALNILRETIMGPELFDFAFKQYSQSWMFKHPSPADFFRIMEDASAVDLDWFWRGWFYTTDCVDISIDKVNIYSINKEDPELEISQGLPGEKNKNNYIYFQRTKNNTSKVDLDPTLRDIYDENSKKEITEQDKKRYEKYISSLSEAEKEILNLGDNYVEIHFSNPGGLVMPIILQFNYDDGSTETFRIPVEIWRRNNDYVSKVFITKKVPVGIILDPFLETADIDISNNVWPITPHQSKLQLIKNDN